MNLNHTNLQASCYDFYCSDYLEDVPFYKAQLQFSDSVLELGVGTGRLAVELAGKARRYVGVDLSEEMLDLCLIKLTERGLQNKVSLVGASMEEVTLNEKFSLILCPFRAFLHLMSMNEKLKALQNMRRHLAQDGRIIIAYYPFDSAYAEKWNGRFFDWIFQDQENNQWIKRDHMTFDLSAQVMKRTVEFYRNNSLMGINDESLAWISDVQFRELAKEAGLEVLHQYGGFHYGAPGAGKESVWILKRLRAV